MSTCNQTVFAALLLATAILAAAPASAEFNQQSFGNGYGNRTGNGWRSQPNPHSLAQLRSNSTGPKMETSVDRRTTTPAAPPKGVDLSNMSSEDAVMSLFGHVSKTAKDDMNSQLKQMQKSRQRPSKRPP